MDADTFVAIGLCVLAVLILALGYPSWLASRGRHQEPVRSRPTYPADDVQRALQHLRNQRAARR